MLLLQERRTVDTIARHGAILMGVVVVMVVVAVGVIMVVEIIIIHGLILISKKKNENKAKNQQEKTTNGDICHRCGMSGYWSRTCRTTQYLVKLYQTSFKAKSKEVETNFVEAGISYNTHIDASDFFQSIENDDKDLPELPLQFGYIPKDFSMLAD
ncbi:UNVERIFIED_CONTAM: hypothetical protein Scaly_2795800 [Sesamum calycinum]|uniref:CCHC-type domain-containing protein n=1 Tax=Sesamum calycinum TaxID=2727403 RepID=A0AAW2IV97_9LAMI